MPKSSYRAKNFELTSQRHLGLTRLSRNTSLFRSPVLLALGLPSSEAMTAVDKSVKVSKKPSAEELRLRNRAFVYGIPCAALRAATRRKRSSNEAQKVPLTKRQPE